MSEQVAVNSALVKRLSEFPDALEKLSKFMGLPAVFTTPPQDFNESPYVVISDVQLNNEDNDCGFRFGGVINVHTWSDSRDMSIVGSLQKSVYDALHHYELPMDGYTIVDLNQEYSNVLLDPDGISTHGIQRFRISLQTT